VIVCDTGPVVSAMNRAEGHRHEFAAALLARLGRRVLVPWPVLTEVDLLLRARGHQQAALLFASAMRDGVHRIDAATDEELALAIELGERYADSGADLPDLTVMAMAARRRASVLTWDYRHFRAVVLRKGHHWPVVVPESDLPPVR
jgi:predicted nucleic acid-binding protein